MSTEDRFVHLTLAGVERIPSDASLRLFLVSACLGRIRGTRGYMPLSVQNRAVGVEISKLKREEILLRTGLSWPTWKSRSKAWVDRRMAHRCRRGVVFLFLSPQDGLAAMCPNCSERLSVQAKGGSRTKPKMAQGVSQTRVPDGGDFNGVKEGVGEPSTDLSTPEASKEFQKQLQERDSEIAALARLKEQLDAKEVAQ